MEKELDQDNLENRRWTAKRKAALVLDIIRGTTTAAQASRTYDLTVGEIEDWILEAMAVWRISCTLA